MSDNNNTGKDNGGAPLSQVMDPRNEDNKAPENSSMKIEGMEPLDGAKPSSEEKKLVASSDVAKQPVEREGNCYCGKERNLNIVELLCASCLRWYHESCIGYQLGKLVPFMMNYFFVCKNCSPTGLESFKKNQAPFPQMCITALGNLMQASVKEGNPRSMFSKDREIIPFIDSHWEGMTTMPRRVTQSWHSTIHRALIKDVGMLFSCEDLPADGIHPLYGLLALELVQIRPNYEAMIRGGSIKVTDMGIQHGGGVKGRSAKRKLPGEPGSGSNKKGRGSELNAPKLPAHGYPLEHPYNKDGYRYILAEPDPHAPFRQIQQKNGSSSDQTPLLTTETKAVTKF